MKHLILITLVDFVSIIGNSFKSTLNTGTGTFKLYTTGSALQITLSNTLEK